MYQQKKKKKQAVVTPVRLCKRFQTVYSPFIFILFFISPHLIICGLNWNTAFIIVESWSGFVWHCHEYICPRGPDSLQMYNWHSMAQHGEHAPKEQWCPQPWVHRGQRVREPLFKRCLRIVLPEIKIVAVYSFPCPKSILLIFFFAKSSLSSIQWQLLVQYSSLKSTLSNTAIFFFFTWL